MSLIALALGPVVAIFFFLWAKDRYEKEPLRRIILTAGIGAVAAIPIVLVELLWGHVLEDIPNMSVNELAFMAFVEVGLTEEFFKAAAFLITAYWSKHMNEPYDGVIYGAAAALGFAAIENVLYVLVGGVGVALLRALTAVPAHAMFGIFVGYFAGRAKFTSYPVLKPILILAGFALAVFQHGLYDFLLFITQTDYPLAFLGIIPLLGLMLLFSLLMIRNARNRSPFKPAKDSEGRYTGFTVSGEPLPPKIAAQIFKKEGYYPGWSDRKREQHSSLIDDYLNKPLGSQDSSGPPLRDEDSVNEPPEKTGDDEK